MPTTSHDCEILIVGCGPTGVTLANLLGKLGRRVLVLERERDVYPIPRATHIDGETLRHFQATGLLPQLLPHTSVFGSARVLDERRRVLLEQKLEDDGVHAWNESRFFDQPAFERILRAGLSRYPQVELLLGAEARQLETAGDRILVHGESKPGESFTIRAQWVVGCDGGRSLVREFVGAGMESLAPKRPWMIVDALLKKDDAARSLPDRFTYYLEPDRLSLYAHGFGRNRRWEFQLGPEESPPSEEEVLSWLPKYLDPHSIEVTRVACYAHNALIAKRWRSGRLLLAGDAAHMMPPSAGQGMCSGIRDAINLAWKLDLVLENPEAETLLETYEQERIRHVREVLEGTLHIGRLLEARGPISRWWRKVRLKTIGAIPTLQNLLEKSIRRHSDFDSGFFDLTSSCFGQFLPQAKVRTPDGEEDFLDNLLGYRFTLLLGPEAIIAVDKDWLQKMGIRPLQIGIDFREVGSSFRQWWTKRKLDFALVRPDRYIFAGGTKSEFERVKGNLSWKR